MCAPKNGTLIELKFDEEGFSRRGNGLESLDNIKRTNLRFKAEKS